VNCAILLRRIMMREAEKKCYGCINTRDSVRDHECMQLEHHQTTEEIYKILSDKIFELC
jgi:hypothetical protein